MALKDLVGTKSALSEALIESVVRGFITYDEEAREVVLTSNGMRLGNRPKILVYLSGLLGWPFVAGDAIPTDAKPAEIERVTGIPGGSLRPLLKELLEERLLSVRDSRYAARVTALQAIAAEVSTPASTRVLRKSA